MTQLNPAVRKLAEQAKGFVDLNQHVGGGNGCMIYTYEGLNKFAELIVRECLTVINQPNGVGDDDVIRISDDVKRHFGVEL